MYKTSIILNYVLFGVSTLLFVTSIFSYIYQQRKIKRQQIQVNIELERRTNELQKEITNLEKPSNGNGGSGSASKNFSF